MQEIKNENINSRKEFFDVIQKAELEKKQKKNQKQFGFKITFSVIAETKDQAIDKFLDSNLDLHELAGTEIHELDPEEIKEYGERI